MAGNQKRQFPYYSAVPALDFKRRAVEGFHPGQAHAEPVVHSFPNLANAASSTNFAAWPEAQIRAFLDQRGEDHDDCKTFPELVQRAHKCEYESGPVQQAPQQALEEEADPLDAFMAEINQEVTADKPSQAKPARELELDEDDPVASFMEARRQNKVSAAYAAVAASGGNEDNEVYAVAKAVDEGEEFDEDDLDALAADKKRIDPLPALDHANIEYDSFAKDFYEEVPEIARMQPAEVNTVRRQLGIRVAGFDPPKPVVSFAHLGFDPALAATIKRAGYDKPTAIQSQAIPAALSGRDVLGIAKTGSGKTAAFVLPMLVHIMDQPELDKGQGPIGLIVAPTRELSEQIHKEARRFSKPYSLRVAAAFGGLSKYEQFKDLKGGSEVAVCTPGRMIDLLKMKACTMLRATFLVFDEADRMFDMGFEPQVRSILGQIRPDRQTLLFSATMPTKVDRLVRDALTSPIRITVGEVGAANEDIRQLTDVVEEAAKLKWLTDRLPGFIDQGDALVFASQKLRVDDLTEKLKAAGFRAAAIHGDMDQHARMSVLNAFKAGTHHVLVATDVAARGLDIKSIKSVVNYDTAKDIDTHVHRVGRTGRAGDREGTAYTLLTPRETRFAGELVESLTAANQEVGAALMALASKDPKFKKGHLRGERGGRGRGRGRRQVGGAGLGFGDPRAPAPPGFAKASQPPGSNPASSFEASFAKGGFERTIDTTATPASQGSAAPQPPSEAPRPPDGQVLPEHPRHPPAPQTQQAAQQQQPPASGRGGVWGGGLKNAFGSRYKNAFVASGTSGGDIGQKATIVAPRQQSQRAVPPPPMPVSARAPPAPSSAPAGASQAVAAAQAIAARLSASLGGAPSAPSAPAPPLHPFAPPASLTATPPRPQSFAPPPSLTAHTSQHPFAPPPSLAQPSRSAQQSSIAAAQAIAARLAAQAQASSAPSQPQNYSSVAPPAQGYPPASAVGSAGPHRGMPRGQQPIPVGPGGMQMGSSRRMWDEVEAQRDRERGSGSGRSSNKWS